MGESTNILFALFVYFFKINGAFIFMIGNEREWKYSMPEFFYKSFLRTIESIRLFPKSVYL